MTYNILEGNNVTVIGGITLGQTGSKAPDLQK